MTKAAICLSCWDIVAPRGAWKVDRRWRWCECRRTATRWQDGTKGLIEITCINGSDNVRVLGLNNLFLIEGMRQKTQRTNMWWQEAHDASTSDVGEHYLFHKNRRNCWALLIRVGETSDVIYVPYDDVIREDINENYKKGNQPDGYTDREVRH